MFERQGINLTPNPFPEREGDSPPRFGEGPGERLEQRRTYWKTRYRNPIPGAR